MLKDILGQAWEAMLYNRRRTAITMLGMAWGIATVVLLLAYGAGERIAFRLPNGPEWFALFLAVQRADLAAVPLDGAMLKMAQVSAPQMLQSVGHWESVHSTDR